MSAEKNRKGLKLLPLPVITAGVWFLLYRFAGLRGELLSAVPVFLIFFILLFEKTNFAARMLFSGILGAGAAAFLAGMLRQYGDGVAAGPLFQNSMLPIDPLSLSAVLAGTTAGLFAAFRHGKMNRVLRGTAGGTAGAIALLHAGGLLLRKGDPLSEFPTLFDRFSPEGLQAAFIVVAGLTGALLGISLLTWVFDLIFGDRPSGGFQRLLSILAVLIAPFLPRGDISPFFMALLLFILIVLLRWILPATHLWMSRLLFWGTHPQRREPARLLPVIFAVSFLLSPLLFFGFQQLLLGLTFRNPFLPHDLLSGFATLICSALIVRIFTRVLIRRGRLS